MNACSGQTHDNKMALQVNFNPTAANIMDLLHIFVVNKQYLFQRVNNYFYQHESFLFQLYGYFFHSYHELFFGGTSNYFSSVYGELFFHWAENYFSQCREFILCLQCFVGLAVKVDWFESLTSLGDHFENFEVEECFQRECHSETLSGKETKEVFMFFTKSVCSQ